MRSKISLLFPLQHSCSRQKIYWELPRSHALLASEFRSMRANISVALIRSASFVVIEQAVLYDKDGSVKDPRSGATKESPTCVACEQSMPAFPASNHTIISAMHRQRSHCIHLRRPTAFRPCASYTVLGTIAVVDSECRCLLFDCTTFSDGFPVTRRWHPTSLGELALPLSLNRCSTGCSRVLNTDIWIPDTMVRDREFDIRREQRIG